MERIYNYPSRELTITKVIDAPVELVWQAWTDAKQIKQWWGPKGFKNPVCKWEPREGKRILIHMRSPDGVVYPMDGRFLKTIKPEHLEFISGALDKAGKRLFEILNTIKFEEQGNKTKLTLHFIVSKITDEGAPYLDGMNEGWKMSLKKMEALLESITVVNI